MDLFDKIINTLKQHLTKEEWVELGERLDGGDADLFLDKVNEHLYEIAPEVFVGPEDNAG